MKPRLTFIVNNKARQKRNILRKIDELFYDYPRMVLQTQYRYHAIILTQQHAESSDIIIGVGGDGNLNEIVNGLMMLPETVQDRIILGLIPAGMANDFNRSLGITADLMKLKTLIDNLSYRKIPLGYLKYQTTYNKEAERYFINDAEIGIAAEAVRKINNSPFTIGNSMSLTFSTLQSFVNFKYPYVRLVSDTVHWQGRITSVVITLGKYFGGGLTIWPDADIFSDKLNLLFVEKVNSQEFLRSLHIIRAGKALSGDKVHFFKTQHLLLEPLEKREAWVQTDGEFLGKAPVEVRIIPNKIKMLTPQKS